LVKVYLDTSVIIALANPQDDFHEDSLGFITEVKKLSIPVTIGDPLLLELGKAVERKGLEAALTILRTIELHKIKLATRETNRLLDLADRYVQKIGAKHRFELLHYASASQLNCSHLASWDRGVFNQSVGKKINSVNSVLGLATLNVGDPLYIARSLGIG